MNQRVIFDVLYQIIISSEEDMFFLEEFDDIRKTFLINLILTKIQFEKNIALTSIFFDIIIILLNKDMTIHSQFKIFIDI